MFSPPMNPARAYAAVGLGTDTLSASPHSLVSMLFEGASVAVASARMYQQSGQPVQKSQCIAKAVAILTDGLMASLDREAGGELADKLYAMYEYMAMRLSEANLGGGNAPLEEVGRLLSELHGAWKSIGRADKTALEPGGT
jgi:flagellar secretion chaperone FliS